jgi:putative inorganic carbon (hco3(-)) transporter
MRRSTVQQINLRQPITITAQIAVAVVVGVLVALLPFTLTVGILGLVILGLLALFTPLVLLVFMVALAPLRVLIATEAPGTMPVDLGQLLLGALLIAWIVRTVTDRRQLLSLSPSPVLGFVGAFVIASGLSGWVALSQTAWLSEWLKWVQVIFLVLLVMDLGQGRTWYWILLAVGLAAAGNAIIGLYQYFGGSGALHLLINEHNFRAFGTFGQPNPFGGFMGLSAPIVVMVTVGYAVRLWDDWRVSRRLSWCCLAGFALFSILSGLTAAGVYISYSRGAWLGFTASLAVLVVAYPRRLWQSATLLIVGVSAAGGLWFAGFVPTSIEARLLSITAEIFNVTDVRGVDITPANYAIVERLAHWQAAIRMVEANPWLGVGAGNYEVAYAQYRLMNWGEALGHAHNYYLNVLAETGIVGALMYLAMWVGIFVVTWQARAHPDTLARSVVVGLLGTWTYLMVHSLTDNLYVNNLFLHIGIFLGLLALLHRQQARYLSLESFT